MRCSITPKIATCLFHCHQSSCLELDAARRTWKTKRGGLDAGRSTIENSSGPLLRSTAAAQARPEWMETNFSASTIIVTLHLPQLSACQRLSKLDLSSALIWTIKRTPNHEQHASQWLYVIGGQLWGEKLPLLNDGL